PEERRRAVLVPLPAPALEDEVTEVRAGVHVAGVADPLVDRDGAGRIRPVEHGREIDAAVVVAAVARLLVEADGATRVLRHAEEPVPVHLAEVPAGARVARVARLLPERDRADRVLREAVAALVL